MVCAWCFQLFIFFSLVWTLEMMVFQVVMRDTCSVYITCIADKEPVVWVNALDWAYKWTCLKYICKFANLLHLQYMLILLFLHDILHMTIYHVYMQFIVCLLTLLDIRDNCMLSYTDDAMSAFQFNADYKLVKHFDKISDILNCGLYVYRSFIYMFMMLTEENEIFSEKKCLSRLAIGWWQGNRMYSGTSAYSMLWNPLL